MPCKTDIGTELILDRASVNTNHRRRASESKYEKHMYNKDGLCWISATKRLDKMVYDSNLISLMPLPLEV